MTKNVSVCVAQIEAPNPTGRNTKVVQEKRNVHQHQNVKLTTWATSCGSWLSQKCLDFAVLWGLAEGHMLTVLEQEGDFIGTHPE